MKRLPLAAFLAAALLVLAPLGARADDFQSPALSPADLRAQQGTPQAPTVIDLRDPAEYRIGHVPGAVNIPQPNLEGRLGELDGNQGLVLYCIVGKRTKLAEQTLMEHGLGQVQHLGGGFSAWMEAGFPVTKGNAP
jgi:rhodanese-related sulfurtransferase